MEIQVKIVLTRDEVAAALAEKFGGAKAGVTVKVTPFGDNLAEITLPAQSLPLPEGTMSGSDAQVVQEDGYGSATH